MLFHYIRRYSESSEMVSDRDTWLWKEGKKTEQREWRMNILPPYGRISGVTVPALGGGGICQSSFLASIYYDFLKLSSFQTDTSIHIRIMK